MSQGFIYKGVEMKRSDGFLLMEFVVALFLFVLVVGTTLRLVGDVVDMHVRSVTQLSLVDVACGVIENRGNSRLQANNDMRYEVLFHSDNVRSEYLQQVMGDGGGGLKMMVYDVEVQAKNVSAPAIKTMYVGYE
jgi:hypothetical protein